MFGSNSAAIIYGIHIFTEFTFLKEDKLRTRITAVMISILGVILSLSLSGLIFIFVIFSSLFLLSRKKRKLLNLVKVISISLLIPYLMYNFVPTFRAKFFSTVTPIFEENANDSSSVQWRFSTWEKFQNIWSEKPLLGQGYGSTKNLNMVGDFLPHNEFLRFLVEGGIFGLLMFIILYYLVIKKFMGFYEKFLDERALYVVSILIGLLINALSENSFTYTVPQYIIAGILGLMFSQFIKMERDSVNAKLKTETATINAIAI
jgi:O-antigen ligase